MFQPARAERLYIYIYIEREREREREIVDFVNPTRRKIKGKGDKLNIYNGFPLIFRPYFRKTSSE